MPTTSQPHPGRQAVPTADELRCERIHLRGAVQGVGFRPFVLRLAREHGLCGTVCNGMRGVEIEVVGSRTALDCFAVALRERPPAAARIDRCSRRSRPIPNPLPGDFRILASDAQGDVELALGPDLAMCPDCRRELLDPRDRRHRYPFLNCTTCGPRFSIVEGLPYDRATTTMRGFAMCPRCRAEYENPLDRRFHAQPTACTDCGPRLAFAPAAGRTPSSADPLMAARDELRAGRCVAVLGLGGFHLCTLATDDAAVARLRTRKRRGSKPFAVMFDALETLRQHAEVDDAARGLLSDPAAPIVLLPRRPTPPAAGEAIAASVAPGHPELGCMLAATPLHVLLQDALGGAPLVATSGNRHDEPICTDLAEARERLAELADGGFLHHDRAVARPLDDSVARIIDGRPQLLRRARGHAPLGFEFAALPASGCDLALGAHLKNSVALRQGRRVVFSAHIGDLETAAAREQHERATADLLALLAAAPERIACDAHPDYASTLHAERRSPRPLRVPHHLAHVLAVACEHAVQGDHAAVAFDGTGYGAGGGDADGNAIWGGEFFVRRGGATLPQRVARLRPWPLAGGERAVREPWRTAYGLVHELFGDAPPAALRVPLPGGTPARPLRQSLRLSPRTSSMGRLFDAVAALLGLCREADYEADAAIRLEHAARRALRTGAAAAAWPLPRRPVPRLQIDEYDTRPLLEALAADLRSGVATDALALRFHTTLVTMLVEFASHCGPSHTLLLTGGCFQNRLLLESSIAALRAAGHRPLWAERLPPGDGGLALGQLAFAAVHPPC